MINTDFEVLAPAGSFQTFKAVIEAGADAVYVGGSSFGARAYADNFTEEELLEAIDYAHLRGKKVYLTVNTLLKNKEINDDLYDYLLPFYLKGLDAVLVQDFGALSYIHKAFPDLPIHTSTQMTVTGIEGVRLLQSYGVTRVVMARETSLAEMKKIHEATGMELEAFVHGALCYCYSGQCLFSSLLGGRSGNRGRCAQPCRLAYTVMDENHKELLKDSYILSMKDMCGIRDINELKEAGVYSLKIEGRMKRPEYAAGVVSFYRKYVDSLKPVSDSDYNKLKSLGNRCGFTDKYYFDHNAKDMITYEKPNFAVEDEDFVSRISARYVDTETRLPVKGICVLNEGNNSFLTVECKNYVYTATGQTVDKAQKKPLIKEDVAKRLSKTGDTSFVFEELEVIMDDNIFMPNGAINELRRSALEGLKNELLSSYVRDESRCSKQKPAPVADKSADLRAGCSASVETTAQLKEVCKSSLISRVYIDWNRYSLNDFDNEIADDIRLVTSNGKKIYIILPAVCRDKTYNFLLSKQDLLGQSAISGFVVKNYEELGWCLDKFPDREIITDHNLYTYNDYAVNAYHELNISLDTMPLELNGREIARRSNADTEMIIYGYYPLMTSAQCVHRNSSKCDKCKQITYLKDRYNKLFPVKNMCNECYNVIYNTLPTMLFNDIARLKESKIHNLRLMFTVEDAAETREILSYFENPSLKRRGEFTNGHYKRGVE